MSLTNMPDTYYPTPRALVDEMLRGVDFSFMRKFLEPSAGTGAICKGIAQKISTRDRWHNKNDYFCSWTCLQKFKKTKNIK